MRKFIVALVILIGVVFLLTRSADLGSIYETLKGGDLRFILLAFVLQTLWLLNTGGSYYSIYRALGIKEKPDRMLMISASAYFVNTAAPTVGMGSFAILISEARRRGYSSARATVAGGLFALFEYLGFLCFLVLGLIVLFRRNNLNGTELTASAILVAVVLMLGIVILLGARSSESLGRFLAWWARQINRLLRPFLHREFLSVHRAYTFAEDVTEGLHIIRKKPVNLIYPAVLALTSKGLLLLVLWSLFEAFNVPYTIGTLVAGFSIGYLFYIVSPTPSGVGIVEGALALALTTLRVPLGAAAVLALAYRGVTFWYPLLVGMLAFRFLGKDDPVKLPSVEGETDGN